MRQLSKWQTMLFLTGGVMMVAGVGCCVFFLPPSPVGKVMCWVALAGALLFAAMQIQQRYDGDNFVVRRLRRMMIMADVLFVVSGVLLADTYYLFLRHLFSNQEIYITYAYNKWVVTLLVSAVLEVYSMHRISSELAKEAKKT